MNVFRIASIATALAVVAGLDMNWPDIKRYMKIREM